MSGWRKWDERSRKILGVRDGYGGKKEKGGRGNRGEAGEIG